MRIIIISGAGDSYWPLLSGMLCSIEQKIAVKEVSAGILNLGLTGPQITRLEKLGAKVVSPQWDYDIKSFEEEPPLYFKAMTARPHLPEYFPGFDYYIWIDADCWIQDWRTIELLLTSARLFGMAVIPEIDRCYSPRHLHGSFEELNYNCIEKCFGQETATKWRFHPILNSGVFAAKPDSKLWQKWPHYLKMALDRIHQPFFLSEQTAFNICIREEKISAAMLPALCNWMCNRARPMLGVDGKTFIEPMPPFNPLGIIHMTADTKMLTLDIPDLRGQFHKVRLAHSPLS